MRHLLPLAAALSACSVFPEATRPPSVIESVRAEYEFAPDAPRSIAVPASGTYLTVLELSVEPAAAGERFQRGQRFLLLPPDCARARVSCRLQRWASEATRDPIAQPHADLFPGAKRVDVVDVPTP